MLELWISTPSRMLYRGSSGSVVKCWNCGALYRFYSHMVGDQSVCPKCRREADQNMLR